MSAKQELIRARDLIKEKRYTEARQVLENQSHPTARKWLSRLDEIELGDPFGGSAVSSERDLARMKSYTTQAIVVLILYFVFFVPGLIANHIWYQEGKRMEAVAGKPLPGVGALDLLRKIAFLSLVLTLILVIVVAVLLAIGLRI